MIDEARAKDGQDRKVSEPMGEGYLVFQPDPPTIEDMMGLICDTLLELRFNIRHLVRVLISSSAQTAALRSALTRPLYRELDDSDLEGAIERCITLHNMHLGEVTELLAEATDDELGPYQQEELLARLSEKVRVLDTLRTVYAMMSEERFRRRRQKIEQELVNGIATRGQNHE